MRIEEFIENFREQLDNPDVDLFPETQYSTAPFWDSLTSIVIAFMINEEYQVDIEPDSINTFKNIEELFLFIKSQKPA